MSGMGMKRSIVLSKAPSGSESRCANWVIDSARIRYPSSNQRRGSGDRAVRPANM